MRSIKLRCTPECIVCVVALVRGEWRAGALARRTPPNWDGALDSTVGKSFVYNKKDLHSLSARTGGQGPKGVPKRRYTGHRAHPIKFGNLRVRPSPK